MNRELRIGIRTRLLLTVVGAVALALVIAVAAFNVLLDRRLTANATSLAKGQAAAELSTLEVTNGNLVTPERPEEPLRLGSPVWVFSGTTAIEKPQVAPSLTAVARSLASGDERTIHVGETIRLYALPVIHDGKQIGTVVAGVPLDPYDETATIAFVGSIALAILLLAAVALLTHWILAKAFEPVSRMTDDAAAWSDHNLDKRFGLGEPYDELTQLAATLDTLLERLSASLRHEQRFTAELSHELRTPLARIAAEAELALRRKRSDDDYRASLAAVHHNAEQMTRMVDALVAAARQEAGLTRTTSDAREAVRQATAAAQADADAAGIAVLVSIPTEPVTVAIEPGLVERIVQPLLDNAIRYGGNTVSVTLARNGTRAAITVTDDGAGVSDEERARIFEPGTRGSAAEAVPHGAGLGLALAQRLARSAGGEITATASHDGGQFSIQLPLA